MRGQSTQDRFTGLIPYTRFKRVLNEQIAPFSTVVQDGENDLRC